MKISAREVHVIAPFVPNIEERPLQGTSAFAARTFGADPMSVAFCRSFSLPVSIIAPFNTCGHRRSLRAVMPFVPARIFNGGDRAASGSIRPRPDFSIVRDVVNALIGIAMAGKPLGDVIKVGNDFEISVGDTGGETAAVPGYAVVSEQDDECLRPTPGDVGPSRSADAKAFGPASWRPRSEKLEGFRPRIAERARWSDCTRHLRLLKFDVFNR